MATHDQENPGGATATLPVAQRPWVAMRALWICAIIAALGIGYAVPAIAQQLLGAPGSTGFKFSTSVPPPAVAAPDVAGPEKVETPVGTSPPPKIHELLTLLADPKNHQVLTLLADPKVQEWLEGQGALKTAAGPAQQTGNSVEGYLNSDVSAIHAQIVALVRAVPDLPSQFARAAGRFTAVHREHGADWALARLAVLVAFGFGAEWLFRKITNRTRGHIDALPMKTVNDRLRVIGVRFALALGIVAAFAVGSVGPFLSLDWNPLRRDMYLGWLIVFVVVRVAAATGDLLLAPDQERFRIIPTDAVTARFWRRRLTAFVGWFALLVVIVQECGYLGFSPGGLELVAYALGLGLLAIPLEVVWRRPITPREAAQAPSAATRCFGRRGRNMVLSIGVVLLWLLWIASPGGVWSVQPGFWLVFVIMMLPPAIRGTRRAVEQLLRPPGSSETDGPPTFLAVSLEHGIQALLIIGAVGVLAHGWGVDLVHLAGQDTLFARIVHGALSAVIILLVADVLWQAAKAAIDRKLAEAADLGQPNTDEARRRSRVRTLLPIFRNVLFFVVIAVAAMMALAAMGVEIGPLIAGAGVVGVAIGFGAQSFVRDVIAGMFYLLDDAFRVGEYVQAGNYKGTIEGFSIRSIKLRHHRGPIYTVPFGVLGAIQNQSRDWVIDKLMVGITYDSNLDLARKLIKQIGLDLAQDPEFAPLIIEPLKMQGVENLGDFAVQIRAKMMTVPGEQFVIRRKAYAMIKKAFDENGIKFAFPTVQLAGDGEPSAAAVAQRALELTHPAAA
jgi:moderate conductance mechanosensitive channel